MKARCLEIEPALLATIFQERGPWQVTKNHLPEDATLVEVSINMKNGKPSLLLCWFASSVFQHSDPDDLPAPQLIKRFLKKED